MEIFNFILLLILGGIIGFAGTFVGIGSGIMLVMVMIFTLTDLGFEEFDTVRLVVANSVFVLLVIHGAAFFKRMGERQFLLKETALIAVPGMVTALLVAYFITNYELIGLNTFRALYVFFSLYVAIFLILNRKQGVFEVCKRSGAVGKARSLFTGGVAGFFTAFIGVDSGTFIVPVLNRYCDIDIRKAVNIYNSAVFFVLLSLLLFYFISVPSKNEEVQGLYSYFYKPVVFPLALGAGLASFFGFHLFKRINFQFFIYPMAFIFTLAALRILFADILFPLYQ